jgi:hypothetical protein
MRWGDKYAVRKSDRDELWRAIAQNTEAMFGASHQQLELASNSDARTNVMRSHWETVNRCTGRAGFLFIRGRL